MMYVINRTAAVVRPRQPLVDWINSQPDSVDEPVSLEEAREDPTVFLLPDFDLDQEAWSYVEELSRDIFEIELMAWYDDEATWPRRRDYQTFREWFDVEIHTTVIDPYEDEIEREEFD
jgi:hypothetical protein